jgi:hypothetical protein
MAVFPSVAKVEKRFVDDAVVEKWLVVVAFVLVLLSAVKFWRVVEPVTRRLPSVASPEVNEVVNDPREAKKLVEVAAVTVALPPMVRDAIVDEPRL